MLAVFTCRRERIERLLPPNAQPFFAHESLHHRDGLVVTDASDALGDADHVTAQILGRARGAVTLTFANF